MLQFNVALQVPKVQRSSLFILACLFALYTKAQPYVDPLNIRYTGTLLNNKNAITFNHLYIGSDLPFKLKNYKLLVISPIYEQWNFDSTSNKDFLPAVNSIALPVSVIVPLGKNRWLLTTTAIPRFNSEALRLEKSFQIGGVLLATYMKNHNLKYKFGAYVNSEFFGLFVVPLVGIDWKIDDNNNLFSVLPGRLTYEHKLSKAFYTGATFRAITNSYRLNNGNYLRIDDNQTSLYLDWYPNRHVVFSGEIGYGIFRKLRTGPWHTKNYTTEYNWGDGTFFKLCASYRIRL